MQYAICNTQLAGDGRSVVMLGTFGLRPKGTMSARALPLAQELAARGWRVRLVLPPWDWPEDANQRTHAAGVDIIQVAVHGGPAAIVRRMIAAADEARPALIHLFKPKGYGGLAAAWLRLAGCPLVVDNDDWEGLGGWNDRVGGYSAAQRLVFAWQARALPRSAAAVTVASRMLEAQAWGLGIPPHRVRYVPNGVSHRRHAGWRSSPVAPPGSDGSADRDGPLLALYTRFDVFRPERLVALLGAMREQLPGARLLVVGRGLAGEEERVRAAAHDAGLDDAFVWAGFMPFAELPAVLRRAGVALYPIDDTLINRSKAPMKLLEVMALGRPVVAEAVGETREYIEHGVSGLLVPTGDHAAFARAVADLVRDSGRRAALGGAAAARVWEHFTWERLVERVESAYAGALRERGEHQATAR